MLPTAIIAFREFLEAFLLIGIFIGLDRKLNLGKRKEILFAAALGIFLSILFPIIVFFFSHDIVKVLTEKNADLFEGYFLTGAGFFIAYVVFTLHAVIKNHKMATIAKSKQKLEQEIFDISLFLTIVLFIAREGLEVAVLLVTTSLFSAFWTNISGLVIGFLAAGCIGLSTFLTYIKLPMQKVFLYTEYFIIVIGAAMVKNGVSILLDNYAHFKIEAIFPLPLHFLPGVGTISGHAINNLFGLQQHMGILQLCIMGVYVIAVQYLFRLNKLALKKKLSFVSRK